MKDPFPSWANLDDCGVFTCTGLYNVLLEFKTTTYSGSPTPTDTTADFPTARFQVSSNNKESTSVQSIDECEARTPWNGYLC